MGVLREISRIPDALHRLTSTLQALAEAQRDNGPSEERLDELERSRSIWEAEVEAGMMKADSKYKAAAAAESRARKQNEKLDPFLEESDEIPEGIPPQYADFGPAETVPAMHQDLGLLSPKELALRMKFS